MLFTTIILLIVLGYVIKSIAKPRNFPPGPKWYPYMGCQSVVEQYSKKHGSQFKGLLELAKEYSTQVLGLKLVNELVVVVYGEKNVKQAFLEQEFDGRPDNFFVRLRCLGKKIGITFADGPLWKEQRQFTVKHLRNVGFSKIGMDKDIQNELSHIIDYINVNNDKPINLKNILPIGVLNVLWKIVAGEQIKEERLKCLMDLFYARSKAFSMTGGWLNQMPWCRFFFPELSGYALINKLNEQISDIIDETIEKHKMCTIKGKDFIYSYLNEMRQNTSNTFTDEQLKIVCLDLIIAGSQTTSNQLEFAFLAALRNKSLQEKLFEEINNTLQDKPPTWADIQRLPYSSAFLLEVQRFYPIAPLVGPRRLTDDVVIDGFLIPKGTTILISIGDLNSNPKIWDEPHEFKPERFIDERGALKNSECMYPFGLGRRRCPGDVLAKSFIFIVFVGVLQKYRIECSSEVVPSEEPDIGLIAGPRPFTAEFVPRK